MAALVALKGTTYLQAAAAVWFDVAGRWAAMLPEAACEASKGVATFDGHPAPRSSPEKPPDVEKIPE